MEFEEFNKKYQDLIFAPLSFNVPDLNIDKLTLWAKENRDLEFKMHLKNNPNMTIEQSL